MDTVSLPFDKTIHSQEITGLMQYGGTRPDTLWSEAGFHELVNQKNKRGRYVWWKLSVSNPKNYRDTIFLFIKPKPIWINTFLLNEDGNLTPIDTAGNWQKADKVYFSQFPEIAYLPLEPNEAATFVIKANILRSNPAKASFQLKDKFATYKGFYEVNHQSEFVRVIHTISMGLITFAAIFFFAYAIINQQRLYFIYFLFILSGWFFSLQFWAHIPFISYGYFKILVFLKHYTFEASTVWMYIFYILFVKDLLEIKKQNSLLAKSLNILCWWIFAYSIIFMVLNISGIYDELVILIYNWFRILVMPVYVFLLIYIILTIKSPVKKFFNLAASVLLFGSLASVLIAMFFGSSITLGKTIINDGDILVISIFIEIILTAMILAFYNAVAKKESIQNQQLYIQQLEENKRLVLEESKKLASLVEEAKSVFLKEQEEKEAEKLARLQVEYENRIQSLKLQTLEAQMNPHFIFNAISAFRDLVLKRDEKNAVKYINAFATLLRKSLTYNKLAAIDLSEELTITSLYLEIEKLRFNHDFIFQVQIDSEIQTKLIQVPPRILQPIVENAIKHGLLPSVNESKNLKIEVKVTADHSIEIIIQDNGIGYFESKKLKENYQGNRRSFGLDLVKERIEIFNQQFESKIHFSISQRKLTGKLSGTKAVFRIMNLSLN